MKRGIALSGGGTKGSYELGVWKALNELGIDYQIVTGTSIGSINGALMATGDYDRAYELWSTIIFWHLLQFFHYSRCIKSERQRIWMDAIMIIFQLTLPSEWEHSRLLLLIYIHHRHTMPMPSGRM